MNTQHCSYWCLGAKAPGHQYPHSTVLTNVLDQFFFYKNTTSIEIENYILKGINWFFNSLGTSDAHVSVRSPVIGSDNGLLPDWRQTIFWTNAGLFSVAPLQTYFSEILIKIQQLSFKKRHLKMSAKWCFFLSQPKWVKGWYPYRLHYEQIMSLSWDV